MIDLHQLRERRDEIALNIKNRNMRCDIDEVIRLQDEKAALQREAEALRTRRNAVASEMKGKVAPERRQILIAEGKELKASIADVEERLAQAGARYEREARRIPNYSHPLTPVGESEAGGNILRHVGRPPVFDFKPLDHVQLGERLDLIDFETAAKVSGPKFYYLKNEAVILEMALERYALDIARRRGFTPMATPDVAKEEILQGIGFEPRGEESNIYPLEGTGTCLVGTAEITLGGYMQGRIFEKSELPVRYAGLSHCFRREAGGAGQYSKGLYRVHQFSKLELFVYCLPEESGRFHEELLSIEEEIFTGLGLAYRVVDIGAGDLGAPAYRKFDIEAWMPGRGEGGEYGEVTSTSNCTDYQARNLNIRYRDDDGKIRFVHMLNGTAVAVSRAMVAVMENYQTKEGGIRIPQILVPLCGFDLISR